MKKRIIIPLVTVLTLILGMLALVIGVSAANEDEAPALEVNGANVAFLENVHLLFSVGYKNVSSPENIKLLVWRESEGIHVDKLTKGTEDYVLSTLKNPPEGLYADSVAFEFSEIAAAEMTENVYVRAYYNDGEGEYLSPVIKYSILQYAMNKLGYTGTASENAKLRAMLVGMLEYGALAQDYFGVRTDRMANELYVKVNLKGATFADGTTHGLFEVGKETDTATADEGSDLPYVIWTDENGNTLGTGKSVTLRADANKTVTASYSSEMTSFGLYDRVVIVGVDGAGSFYPDEINENSKRIQDKIFGDGAVTHTMRTVSPTSSCPAWTSALHGVNPENHGLIENGIVENSDGYPMDSKYPSFLQVVKNAYPYEEVAALYSWIGIHGIVEQTGGITTLQASDTDLMNYIVNHYIPNNDAKALYIHLGNPDSVGHNQGHRTEAYFDSIDQAYVQIEEIYDALDKEGLLENTLFIVTSDHGGEGKGHGGLTDYEKYVMFAAAGHTVKKGGVPEDMEIRDVASIALYALGITAPNTYTGAIPAELFEGVAGTEHTEYHDPDSPRYHLPEATPTVGTQGYITNFITKNLEAYLTFDGTTADSLGNKTVEENGKITYEDGYFGQGVKLDDGYLDISAFEPGTDSFTIAMWVKIPSPHMTSPIIANKPASTSEHGFMIALERVTSSSGWRHYARFNFGNGVVSATRDIDLPEDYYYGWTHIIIVFDREAEEMRLVYDFGHVYSNAIHNSYATMEGTDMTSIYKYLTLGNDATGETTYECGLSVDEFMLFDGAFTKEEIAALGEYYGKTQATPSAPAIDIFDTEDKPDLYFDFDNNYEFIGGSPAFTTQLEVTGHNRLTYAEGKRGNAAYFSGTEYVNVSDLKFGTDSFSVAMWVNPTDLSFGGGSRYKLPLISNASDVSREKQGFNVLLDTEYQRLVVTLGNGEANKGMQEYVSFPRDTYEGKWTHIAVVYDRDTGYLRIYVNFQELLNKKMVYNGTSTPIPADLSSDSDYTVKLGQLGKPVTAQYAKVYLDDVMIFTRAIDALDVLAIEKSWAKPLTDFLDKTPLVNIDFDGNITNKGTYDGAVTDGGITYTGGASGLGATMTDSAGVNLNDLKLDGDAYTFSFMMNIDNFGYGFSYGDYWYRNIFSTQDDNTTESLGFSIVHKGDMGERGGIFINIANEAGARLYVGSEFPADMVLNEWVLVTVVVDKANNNIDIYYNGVEGAYLTEFNVNKLSSMPLNGAEGFTPHIGQDGQGDFSYPYSERLDDFIIYDSALTADEVARLAAYYGINVNAAE